MRKAYLFSALLLVLLAIPIFAFADGDYRYRITVTKELRNGAFETEEIYTNNFVWNRLTASSNVIQGNKEEVALPSLTCTEHISLITQDGVRMKNGKKETFTSTNISLDVRHPLVIYDLEKKEVVVVSRPGTCLEKPYWENPPQATK